MQRTAMKVGQILDICPGQEKKPEKEHQHVSVCNTEGAPDKMNTVAL